MNERQWRHVGRVARAEIETKASREDAWSAWADPDWLRQWFADDASGQPVPGDALILSFEAFGFSYGLEVVEASPGECLVLKTQFPGQAPRYQEVVLSEVEGGTRVEIIHSGFDTAPGGEDEFEGVLSGWQIALQVLRYYLEHHPGADRRRLFLMRPAVVDYAALLPLYTSDDGLASWLGGPCRIAGPGGAFELTSPEGLQLSGTVLGLTRREVVLQCDDIDGVLALKAFQLGPTHQAIAIDLTAWSLDDATEQLLRGAFEAALERLAAVLDAQHPPQSP